jgi:hypothetical protein
MCWSRKKQITLKSEEYLELKTYLDKLRLSFSSLELDVGLYTKKLRMTRGLSKKEEETETEKNNNTVILPT